MGDKSWKRHERTVARHFGTERALHGLDRDKGEVHTDVFVDVHDWYINKGHTAPEEELDRPTCLVVECKYSSKKSGNRNDWPCEEIHAVWKDRAVKGCDVIPIFVTRDKWIWCKLDDLFEVYQHLFEEPVGAGTVFRKFLVRHVNREMSSFFKDAFDEALTAYLPERRGVRKPFARKLHVICVGTNARLPKAVGIPPGALEHVSGEEK